LKDLPVILRGREAEDIFAWFFDNASTEAIFTKASSFFLGMNVQQTDPAIDILDPLDIWAEPIIPGLPNSCPYDGEGFPLERTQVVDRRLKMPDRGNRYADWLGQPEKGLSLISVSREKSSRTAARQACLE
jgi:predicted Zn-dependent protease